MKSTFSAFFKNAVFLLLIDPIFSISAAATVIFCAFRFFISSQFFVMEIGTSDLRFLFSAIPAISVLTIPLLTLRLRPLIFDDSVPMPPFLRFSSILSAIFSASLFSILPLCFVPIFVSFFGDIDISQAILGFFGIILFEISAISMSLMLNFFVKSSPAAFFLSAILLFFFCSVHLAPIFFSISGIFGAILRNLSFSWRFDPFSKGIVDLKSVVSYAILPLFFCFCADFAERKRTGKKILRAASILFLISLFLLFFSAELVSARFDFSTSKRFSVSKTTASLLKKLDSPLRITYFRSSELSSRFPKSKDVLDFLVDFCDSSPMANFFVQDADPQKLASLGIRGRQISSATGTHIEYLTIFSAIVLDYGGKRSVIPFSISTDTLEFDLAQRLQTLISGRTRKVLVICGNSLVLDERYNYVLPWLSSRGFFPETAGISELQKIRELNFPDSILILGSSALPSETAAEIESALNRKVPVFAATSLYTVPVEDSWEVSKNQGDNLIPVIARRGIEFGDSLVADISCVPTTFKSGEGESAEFMTENNPLWISILPQKSVSHGMTVFWASPLILDDNTEPVLWTSDFAWCIEESGDEKHEFQTDPTKIPKTAALSNAVAEKICVGAKSGNLFVISDQYFLDSLMTGFISGETPDVRNFDFLCSELFRLRKDDFLCGLMEKSKPNTSLYKITDNAKIENLRNLIFLFFFALVPILIFAQFFLILFWRKKCQKKN